MMKPTQEFNCYEYLHDCVDEYGEYNALEHFGHKTSIREFLRDVDCLASFFKEELGLGRGDVFTVFLPTCAPSFTAFYALNKIGAIANFIHPLTPPQALQETMEIVESKGILIMDMLMKDYSDIIKKMGLPCMICSLADYAAPLRRPFVKLFGTAMGRFPRGIKKRYSFAKACRMYEPQEGVYHNARDVAVHMCGGGTTGKSKIIQLSSKALNELIYQTREVEFVQEPGVDASVTALPMFHAFGMCVAMHLPMCNAVRLIPMARFNAKTFNGLMHKNKVVYLVGIPVMFRKLRKEKNFEGEHLRHLHLMFCGGDDVSEAVLDDFNECLEKWGARGKLYRGYGLTEVSSGCCVNRVGCCSPDSIGKPLLEMHMEIWDENKMQVPNGEVGEIVISGDTVMEGYLTREKIPNDGVYIDENGTRWVLSGDLGYEDDEGFFYFSGRKKRIIIISGYNVYPKDVEGIVEELPFVREVCAVKSHTPDGKTCLKLCVCLNPDERGVDFCKQEIMKRCESELPSYSVPRKIEILDLLPRTLMQKIDFVRLMD